MNKVSPVGMVVLLAIASSIAVYPVSTYSANQTLTDEDVTTSNNKQVVISNISVSPDTFIPPVSETRTELCSNYTQRMSVNQARDDAYLYGVTTDSICVYNVDKEQIYEIPRPNGSSFIVPEKNSFVQDPKGFINSYRDKVRYEDGNFLLSTGYGPFIYNISRSEWVGDNPFYVKPNETYGHPIGTDPGQVIKTDSYLVTTINSQVVVSLPGWQGRYGQNMSRYNLTKLRWHFPAKPIWTFVNEFMIVPLQANTFPQVHKSSLDSNTVILSTTHQIEDGEYSSISKHDIKEPNLDWWVTAAPGFNNTLTKLPEKIYEVQIVNGSIIIVGESEGDYQLSILNESTGEVIASDTILNQFNYSLIKGSDEWPDFTIRTDRDGLQALFTYDKSGSIAGKTYYSAIFKYEINKDDDGDWNNSGELTKIIEKGPKESVDRSEEDVLDTIYNPKFYENSSYVYVQPFYRELMLPRDKRETLPQNGELIIRNHESGELHSAYPFGMSESQAHEDINVNWADSYDIYDRFYLTKEGLFMLNKTELVHRENMIRARVKNNKENITVQFDSQLGNSITNISLDSDKIHKKTKTGGSIAISKSKLLDEGSIDHIPGIFRQETFQFKVSFGDDIPPMTMNLSIEYKTMKRTPTQTKSSTETTISTETTSQTPTETTPVTRRTPTMTDPPSHDNNGVISDSNTQAPNQDGFGFLSIAILLVFITVLTRLR